MGFSDVDAENKPLSFQNAFEAKRSTHLQELQQKEDEMRQMFVVRVKEKESELKEAEKEVSQRKCMLTSRYVSLKQLLHKNQKYETLLTILSISNSVFELLLQLF